MALRSRRASPEEAALHGAFKSGRTIPRQPRSHLTGQGLGEARKRPCFGDRERERNHIPWDEMPASASGTGRHRDPVGTPMRKLRLRERKALGHLIWLEESQGDRKEGLNPCPLHAHAAASPALENLAMAERRNQPTRLGNGVMTEPGSMEPRGRGARCWPSLEMLLGGGPLHGAFSGWNGASLGRFRCRAGTACRGSREAEGALGDGEGTEHGPWLCPQTSVASWPRSPSPWLLPTSPPTTSAPSSSTMPW